MEFYTEQDIQKILKLGPRATHALFLNDDFPGKRIGKSYRIEKSAFEEWLNNTKEVGLDYSWNR